MFLLNAFSHLHKRTLLSVLTSLHRELPCVKLFLLVGISVLCMCKSCRVEEFVQSVGHEHSVLYHLGDMLKKFKNPTVQRYCYRTFSQKMLCVFYSKLRTVTCNNSKSILKKLAGLKNFDQGPHVARGSVVVPRCLKITMAALHPSLGSSDLDFHAPLMQFPIRYMKHVSKLQHFNEM